MQSAETAALGYVARLTCSLAIVETRVRAQATSLAIGTLSVGVETTAGSSAKD